MYKGELRRLVFVIGQDCIRVLLPTKSQHIATPQLPAQLEKRSELVSGQESAISTFLNHATVLQVGMWFKHDAVLYAI